MLRSPVKPVTLQGLVVRLEPLNEKHIPDLTLAGKDPNIWRYLPYGELICETRMRDHVQYLMKRAEQGLDLPFAVIDKKSNKAIGMSNYLYIEWQHKKLEVGGTWYEAAYQRTRVNTECKYLLLTHAFERLGCVRVQFKTDARNLRSQKALERINAVKEGVLRKHLIMPDGYVRDSVYYSIIASEWPASKAILEEKLAGAYQA